MSHETIQHLEYRIVDQVIACICNRCGSKTLVEKGNHSVQQNHFTFRASGGWCNDWPGDLNTVEFALCSACLKEWTESFVVPVHKTSAAFMGNSVPRRVSMVDRDRVELWDGSRFLGLLTEEERVDAQDQFDEEMERLGEGVQAKIASQNFRGMIWRDPHPGRGYWLSHTLVFDPVDRKICILVEKLDAAEGLVAWPIDSFLDGRGFGFEFVGYAHKKEPK